MADKSNAEIAQEVITDWHDYEKWHDPSMMPIPPFSGAQEEELSRLIESAISTAQSNLAREVLAEIVKYKAPFALVHGVEGDIIDVTCEQVTQRLRELFTRLGISVEDGSSSLK